MLKYPFITLSFLTGCKSADQDKGLTLTTEAKKLQYKILIEQNAVKTYNCEIATKAYMLLNANIQNLIQKDKSDLSPRALSQELEALHQKSIETKDSLILRSSAISYGCIKGRFVHPLTSLPRKQGKDWASHLVNDLTQIQIDSVLRDWYIKNLEWQIIVLEQIKNTE